MVKSKKFPGQPIFSQVLQLIPREILSSLVKQYGSDRYVKKFKTFDQLVAMLFCALERCTSTREVQTGLQVWEGRLVHLGVHSYPCRSTLSDANRRCPEALFGDLYHALVKLYYPQLFPDSRAALSQSERLFIIDSSTIELFQDVMRGAGMGKMDGRRKGGVKAHTMINAAHNIPCLVYLSEAKENDRVVMDKIDVPKGSILVFDKGYVKYRQWQKWTEAKIYWVTRLNDEAYYQVLEDRPVNEKQANAGVSEDQLILLGSGTTPGSEVIMARRVKYYDADKERWFVFVTNHTQFSASHIADLYRLVNWQLHNLDKINGEILNAGGGLTSSTSLQELTQICQEVTGKIIPIKQVPETRTADIRMYITDNTKVTRLTGWAPQIGVRQIVEDITDWLDNNNKALEPILK